jgi:hypothetical protein
MKKLFLAFLMLLIASISVRAQNKPHKVVKPGIQENFQETLNLILTQQSVMMSMYAFSYKYSSLKNVKSISSSDAKQLFIDSISRKQVSLQSKKYNAAAINYLDGLHTFGETSANMILDLNGNLPLSMSIIGDKKVFIQSGIFDSYSLNTLKLDPDERAKHIVKSVILPSLSNFQPLADIEIDFFVLNVGYIAKDFSDDNSGDGEMTSIVIDKATLLKYINAEITDSDVLRLSKFYNSNKNMSGSIRRILIN